MQNGVGFHFAEASCDIAANERLSLQNRGDLHDKKNRTFRPLANKEDLLLSRWVSSICRRRGERDPRRVSLVRQDVFARARVRILNRETRKIVARESSLIADAISLSVPPFPRPWEPLDEERKKKEGGGSNRRGCCGNKNIDGSVPAHGRDNRLIIHRPRDRAGYSGTSARARAHMTSLILPLVPSPPRDRSVAR